jgi:hypothetical protein
MTPSTDELPPADIRVLLVASPPERDEFRMKSSRSDPRRGLSAAYSMYFL